VVVVHIQTNALDDSSSYENALDLPYPVDPGRPGASRVAVAHEDVPTYHRVLGYGLVALFISVQLAWLAALAYFVSIIL
jgi:hypothetical protein